MKPYISTLFLFLLLGLTACHPQAEQPQESQSTPEPKRAPGVVAYELDEPGQVSLAVYDGDGHLVRTLLSGDKQKAGAHRVRWDGRDRYGHPLPAGDYEWRLLRTPGFKAKLLGVFGVNPPTLENQWTGNHEGAQAVFVKDDAMYVGAGSTENVTSYLKQTLDGNKYFWEQAGPWGVPGGFGGGVRLAATDGVLYRLTHNAWVVPVSAETGSAYTLWSGDVRTVTYYYKWDVKLPDQERQEWDGDKHQMDLDARDGAVVVSYRDFDLLRWLDPEASPKRKQSGSRRDNPDPAVFSHTVQVAHPRSIALINATTALVLSEDRVIIVNQAGAQRLVIPAERLENPTWIDVDHETREILVYQGPPSRQVLRFDSKGNLLATYGRYGGREYGPYVPENFRRVADLAADDRGGFVVAENDLRRVAHFNRDGDILNQWYGGQNFFHFTTIDPDDTNRLFFGGGGHHLRSVARMNYETGDWRVTEVYDQSDLALMPGTTWAYHQWHAMRRHGKLFLVTDNGGAPAILRVDEQNNRLVPVARIGMEVKPNSHPALWQAALKNGQAAEKRSGRRAAWCWADRNGDGEAQVDEFTFSKRRRHDIPGLSYQQTIDARQVAFDDDWNVYLPNTCTNLEGYDNVAWYVLPNLAESPDQAPVWDWQTIRPADAAMPPALERYSPWQGAALHRSDNGDIYQMLKNNERFGDKFPADHRGHIRLAKWNADGDLEWVTGVHGTTKATAIYTPKKDIIGPNRIYYPARILGEAHDCIVFADRWTHPATAWTKDGLYAGYFLDRRADDGLPERFYHWWRADVDNRNDSVIPTDCLVGGTMRQLPDGNVLWLPQGNQGNPAYLVSGWTGWTRNSGPVRIDQEAERAEKRGTGLTATFFDSVNPTNEPLATANLPELHLNPKKVADILETPRDELPMQFSAVFEGEIEIPVSDEWVFKVPSGHRFWNSHLRMWIDGEKVLDTRQWDAKTQALDPELRKLRDAYDGVRAYTFPMRLEGARRHPLRIEWSLEPSDDPRVQRRLKKTQPTLPASIRLMWQSTGLDREVVPTEFLYPVLPGVLWDSGKRLQCIEPHSGLVAHSPSLVANVAFGGLRFAPAVANLIANLVANLVDCYTLLNMAHSLFSYEKLHVHADMLQFLHAAEEHVSAWDPVHAVVDQFERASEGFLVSMAEASRARSLGIKTAAIDCSLGSILECAGCMDIAEAKSLIGGDAAHPLKRQLVTIFGKLIGLRKTWSESCVREPGATYGHDSGFHHERLDVYQLALRVVRQLAAAQLVDRLSRGAFRRIDEPATSMVLNIAEGNGRFAHLDHQRFLEIANRATTKLAARLELGTLRGVFEETEKNDIKEVLVRVDAMTAALARRWSDPM